MQAHHRHHFSNLVLSSPEPGPVTICHLNHAAVWGDLKNSKKKKLGIPVNYLTSVGICHLSHTVINIFTS